jgi:hypothetical protein
MAAKPRPRQRGRTADRHRHALRPAEREREQTSGGADGRAARRLSSVITCFGRVVLDFRQHWRAFLLRRVEQGRIEPRRLHNGGRDLTGCYEGRDCLWRKVRIRNQHNDVGIVMREAAVIADHRSAVRVRHVHVRSYDDVGRPGILLRLQCRPLCSSEPRSVRRKFPPCQSEPHCFQAVTAAFTLAPFFNHSTETSSSVAPMPVGLRGDSEQGIMLFVASIVVGVIVPSAT